MARKKNLIVKIFAFFALFGIVIGIIGTGLLFITGAPEEQDILTNKEFQKLLESGAFEQKIDKTTSSGEIEVNSGKIEILSGAILDSEISTGSSLDVNISTGEILE